MAVLKSAQSGSGIHSLYEFTQGVDVDCHLYEAEIRVQKAWAQELERIAILTTDETIKIIGALDEALGLMRAGQFEWRVLDEDIHMNLERFVTDRLGALGKKMHLGRSRNDLIATTSRLQVADDLGLIWRELAKWSQSLANRAERDIDSLVPGVTHVQAGQPIRLSQLWLSYGFGVKRDRSRLNHAIQFALDVIPLGSAALAGTTLAIDSQRLATSLGFKNATECSYDSVGDRDFFQTAMSALAQVAVRLSRFSEDMIYWSSSQVGLLVLSKDWSTGSSIMPNKRNPDIPELVRAKSGRIMAIQNEMNLILKGLPTSYDSDLHELKRSWFLARNELLACLGVLTPFTETLTVSPERAHSLLNQGHLLATEIANEKVMAEGIPFRDAYLQVGELVAQATQEKRQVHECYGWGHEAYEAAVERRVASGGTARVRVLESIAALRAALT